MVEIDPSTSAGEVVQMVQSQASLEKLGAGSGGWMLWEVAQDFGMGNCSCLPGFLVVLLIPRAERPIREYELLSDVEASWNKDKLVNIFVIKKTPLASLLSRSVRCCLGFGQYFNSSSAFTGHPSKFTKKPRLHRVGK
jgi:hypothetical protein